MELYVYSDPQPMSAKRVSSQLNFYITPKSFDIAFAIRDIDLYPREYSEILLLSSNPELKNLNISFVTCIAPQTPQKDTENLIRYAKESINEQLYHAVDWQKVEKSLFEHITQDYNEAQA